MSHIESSTSATPLSASSQLETRAILSDGVARSLPSARSRAHRNESGSNQKTMNYEHQQIHQLPIAQRRHTFSHGYMSRSAPSTPIVGAHSQQGHGAGYFRGLPMTPAAGLYTFDSHSIPSSSSSRAVSPRRRESSPTSVYESPNGDLSRSPSPTTHNLVNESTQSPHLSTPPKSYGSNWFNLSGCQYETALINARRRIPYSLGTDPLPPMPLSTIKENLSVRGEAILTKDIENLFGELLPTDDSACRRRKFIEKLERLLNEEWPGNDIRVHPFGSTENLLCSSDSDVDVCISTPWKRLEDTCMLAKFWSNHSMERVICVPGAKVPIVKIWDPEYDVACDMNVNNMLALENTKMIKTYVQIDPRVRPLAMIIKHWTKQRSLNDAAGGGTLSSYSWICLIINFLQLRTPPILPVLHKIGSGARPENVVNGVDISFCDNLEYFVGYGEENTESLGQLLFEFFKWYAYDFDYDRHVVSVRQGRLLSKAEKGWDTLQNNRFCIEEPLVTSRNLGNTADDISAKGILQEFRRAYEILSSDANLAKCVKKFEFPDDDSHVVMANRIGLIMGNAGRRITRSVSSSGSSTRSVGGRSLSRGGFYRSQSHRKGSTGTYQGNNMAPGGVYPPPIFKLPTEYGIMPIYSMTLEGYPIAISQPTPITKSGSASNAEGSYASEGKKSSNSIASEQFGYIIPAYFPNPRYPLYYQPAYEEAQASAATNPPVSETSEIRSGRARSLSPSRQSIRHRNHRNSQNDLQDQHHVGLNYNYSAFKRYTFRNSNGNMPPGARSEYLPQSSESGSDLSDISPDVPPHAYPPITPPDCRLDGLVNDADDDYDLKLSSLHIGGRSDQDGIEVGDDEDGDMTTDSEGATFVAQKELVDRMQGIGRPGYPSPPASRSSSTSLPNPLSSTKKPVFPGACSAETEGEGENGNEASGPVIVNGDLSSRSPRAMNLMEDSQPREVPGSRSGSKSYADVLMDQRISLPKSEHVAAIEKPSSNLFGNLPCGNEITEMLDSSLAEFEKNQLNRTSGMRNLNRTARNIQHNDDDTEFWAVSSGSHGGSLSGASHVLVRSPTIPLPASNGTLSYSAAASGSISTGSSKPRNPSTANGIVGGGSGSITGKQNQWTTSTSKRSRKKKNAKKEDGAASTLISEELVKGG
ncbi:hypothetical protein V1517DRAFT_144469 [Lipomyces orientalis]|uniref:Uncharacterized protein n=1 Tax=Lipomyces orientalis TaxID=1233043 RepID=A0ACC3TWY8_9ASCO